MKKISLIGFVFFFFQINSSLFNFSYAQSIAGYVPAGTSIVSPNIFLADSTIGSPVSDSIDLDCDDIMDAAIDLRMGAKSIDEPHLLYLRPLGNSIEFWREPGNYRNMLPFYSAGDTMCIEGYQWNSDSLLQLACGNGFCWSGIHQATDVYIAYRSISTQQIGWIKLTFDINWAYPITASISELLVLCTNDDIDENDNESGLKFLPNPTTNGKFTLQSKRKIMRVEIFNAKGELVQVVSGSQTEITLPDEDGLYLLRTIDLNGKFCTGRVLRK